MKVGRSILLRIYTKESYFLFHPLIIKITSLQVSKVRDFGIRYFLESVEVLEINVGTLKRQTLLPYSQQIASFIIE